MFRINACLNLMILLFIYLFLNCTTHLFALVTYFAIHLFVFVHLKGMLRDITKGGRGTPFDKSEPVSKLRTSNTSLLQDQFNVHCQWQII